MSTVLDVRILRTVLRSYFDEIKDAMHSLKSYLHTGLDGLAKLAKTIEVVEQFVDATIDEDCEPFMCPKGFVREVNPLHKPESNGCGSFGYRVCIGALQVCSSREEDLSMLFMKACKGTAKLMYTGTLALGCKAYQDAQIPYICPACLFSARLSFAVSYEKTKQAPT
ncbi:hypothetical protein OUZ56_024897 [Daphnia magna]|uniref:Uncharacterized protein n=1 Tax=Daphnia magna TaxID=35525 RepID=A0ABQ9ZIA8_9CRUS|nr:hypothetical protein OUZ56_024897 [Daphnia magna]